MKRIIEFFKLRDKQLHFAACLLITFFVGLFDVIVFHRDGWTAAAIGFTAAMIIGFFKEAVDEMFRDGCVDVKDLIADFVGATTGLVLTGLIF